MFFVGQQLLTYYLHPNVDSTTASALIAANVNGIARPVSPLTAAGMISAAGLSSTANSTSSSGGVSSSTAAAVSAAAAAATYPSNDQNPYPSIAMADNSFYGSLVSQNLKCHQSLCFSANSTINWLFLEINR